MENALVISDKKEMALYISGLLKELSFKKISVVSTCKKAREMFVSKQFEFVIIYISLCEENLTNLSEDITFYQRSEIILVLSSNLYIAADKLFKDDSIVVISEPVRRDIILAAIKLMRINRREIKKIESENSHLLEKIEDIKIVDRAKCILISYLSMNENEAHKYIEKQAMNTRVSKRKVAEEVLKTYEN